MDRQGFTLRVKPKAMASSRNEAPDRINYETSVVVTKGQNKRQPQIDALFL